MIKGISGFIGRSGFSGALGFVGAIGYKLANTDITPIEAIFNWPFFTGSLDETIEGIDATFTNSTDNVPTFDSNGLVLDSANSDNALAPVSTSQVDDPDKGAGAYLGDLTTGGWVNGVNIGVGRIAFLGTTASGKYEQNVTADWDGAIAKGSNGVLLSLAQVSAVAVSYTLLYNPTPDTDDDAIQAGFENTGDSSNLFTIYFHTSGYTLADIKALRLSVGDGSTWVDTPVNDFCREVEFSVDADVEHGAVIVGRYIDANNSDFLTYFYDPDLGSLKIAGSFDFSSSADSVGVVIPSYTIGDLVEVRCSKRSSALSDIFVTYQGVTYSDFDSITYDLAQGVSSIYGQYNISQVDFYSFTVKYNRVGSL